MPSCGEKCKQARLERSCVSRKWQGYKHESPLLPAGGSLDSPAVLWGPSGGIHTCRLRLPEPRRPCKWGQGANSLHLGAHSSTQLTVAFLLILASRSSPYRMWTVSSLSCRKLPSPDPSAAKATASNRPLPHGMGLVPYRISIQSDQVF